MTPIPPRPPISFILDARELGAARHLVQRLHAEVPAELIQVTLFGSRARGEARPDSDIDLLLMFRRLPPNREPHASIAEEIADEVAERTGVPLTVWSVSLVDLEPGLRTPMLVDALRDSIPLWSADEPVPPLPFTPLDALRCTGSLLNRVEEGEAEVAEHLHRGDVEAAKRRVRDDLVRMCVGLHLLRGETRPRRGEAARRLLGAENGALPAEVREALRWAADSYGPDGRDEEGPVPAPPAPSTAVRSVGHLRGLLTGRRRRLAERLGAVEPAPASPFTSTRAPRLHWS